MYLLRIGSDIIKRHPCQKTTAWTLAKHCISLVIKTQHLPYCVAVDMVNNTTHSNAQSASEVETSSGEKIDSQMVHG